MKKSIILVLCFFQLVAFAQEETSDNLADQLEGLKRQSEELNSLLTPILSPLTYYKETFSFEHSLLASYNAPAKVNKLELILHPASHVQAEQYDSLGINVLMMIASRLRESKDKLPFKFYTITVEGEDSEFNVEIPDFYLWDLMDANDVAGQFMTLLIGEGPSPLGAKRHLCDSLIQNSTKEELDKFMNPIMIDKDPIGMAFSTLLPEVDETGQNILSWQIGYEMKFPKAVTKEFIIFLRKENDQYKVFDLKE